MNVLILLIMEEIVEVIKVVLRERISERIREQIVDVRVPRAVEQATEGVKTKEISVLAKTMEEQTVRVETLAVEVEKMRSELFEAEAPSEMSHTSCRDGETSMATGKEDLEADTAKHSTLLETSVFRSSLDGEVSSRDQILQWTVEQVLDVPVPEMVEVPKTVSQDKIQQRIVEQIIDVPVPQVVKELVEVSKVFPQDRVQQCFTEQTIETPAILLAVKIIEAPVIRTHEKTQQLVNTHVQHVVNTVEVEEPKLIKETVQRKKPLVQEKINQVTKHIDVLQLQFLDKADDMPVVVQRQVYMNPEIQTVQGAQTSENLGTALVRQLAQAETVEVVEIGDAVEVVQVQDIDKIMDVFPILMQRPVPTEQTVLKGLSGVCEEKHMSGILGTSGTDRTFRIERHGEHGQRDHVTEEQTKRRARMARQVWVKCGMKTKPLELNDETPEEIERKVRKLVNVNSSEKVYVLCQGKVVQWSKWMEMEEGCIFEVMLPMKGGGKQKQKKKKKGVNETDRNKKKESLTEGKGRKRRTCGS